MPRDVREVPSLQIKTVAWRHSKTHSDRLRHFFFCVGGPPTQNLIYIRANILPAGFMPAGEMKQRGADILSQHSNSSLSLSLCAGCLSTGGGGGGGGGLGGGGAINLPVRWPKLASQWETLRQAGSRDDETQVDEGRSNLLPCTVMNDRQSRTLRETEINSWQRREN